MAPPPPPNQQPSPKYPFEAVRLYPPVDPGQIVRDPLIYWKIRRGGSIAGGHAPVTSADGKEERLYYELACHAGPDHHPLALKEANPSLWLVIASHLQQFIVEYHEQHEDNQQTSQQTSPSPWYTVTLKGPSKDETVRCEFKGQDRTLLVYACAMMSDADEFKGERVSKTMELKGEIAVANVKYRVFYRFKV